MSIFDKKATDKRISAITDGHTLIDIPRLICRTQLSARKIIRNASEIEQDLENLKEKNTLKDLLILYLQLEEMSDKLREIKHKYGP